MKSGILMYDGGEFHQFPGLEEYYSQTTEVLRKFTFSQGSDKVYASLYSPNAIKYFRR